jgi:hypothetical protein
MKGYKLFLLAIVPIILAMIYPGLRYSLTFGWHTIIESETSSTTFILLGILLFTSFLYWLLDNKTNRTNKYLTLSHFLMTIVPLYYILWGPDLLFFLFDKNLEKLLSTLGENFFINALFISYAVPMIGQIIFLINMFIGIWKTANNRPITLQ